MKKLSTHRDQFRLLNRLFAGALMVSIGICVPPSVWSKVICPVCGEAHDDDVDECPNDGTNLRMLGKPSETGGDENTDSGKDNGSTSSEDKNTENRDTSDPSQSESGAEAETNENGTQGDEPPILYKRHDKGGERKPATSKESSGYSDRMSRIPGGGRLGPPVKKEPEPKKRPKPPKKEDPGKKSRTDFETRRQHQWLKRPEIQLDTTADATGSSAARKRLLEHLAAPLATLGLRLFWMGEENHPGPVGAAEIAVNLARYRLRIGLASLLGIRSLEARNELVFLQSAEIGFQWPRRFSPYILARGGLGLIATERFNESLVHMMSAVGAEVGIDAWISPWTAISPSFGFVRYTLNDAYWHSVTLKIAIGF